MQVLWAENKNWSPSHSSVTRVCRPLSPQLVVCCFRGSAAVSVAAAACGLSALTLIT